MEDYDESGNNHDYDEMDELTYSYKNNGNKLDRVDDSAPNTGTARRDFDDNGSNQTNEYA